MFARPLPLLSAFVGGCLCTALVIGLVHSEPTVRGAKSSERQASVFVSALGSVPANTPEIQAEPVPVDSPDDAGPSEPAGSSLADVLARLETAYQQVSGTKRAEVTPAAPVPTAEAAVTAPPAEVTPAATTASAAPAPAPVMPSAPAPSVAAAIDAVPETPPADPVAESEPARAAEPAPRTYVAEVHQDIHVGDVYQGNRYQVEQLAVLQYLQLLALSSYAGGLSAPGGRALAPRRPLRSPQTPRFPITVIPNPDNPWGFRFPPPALVK